MASASDSPIQPKEIGDARVSYYRELMEKSMPSYTPQHLQQSGMALDPSSRKYRNVRSGVDLTKPSIEQLIALASNGGDKSAKVRLWLESMLSDEQSDATGNTESSIDSSDGHDTNPSTSRNLVSIDS